MRKNKYFLFLVLSAIGGMVLASPVMAQGGIGISPVTFEITANPGDKVENLIKVYNPSPDVTIRIEMQVEDIAPTGETGHVKVEPAETETYSLARWIKCEPEEFSLAPKEEKFVKFVITVPENAEPGGHYGTVLAATKAAAGLRGGMAGTAVVQRVGSLVLLTIPGVMKEEVAVKDFATGRLDKNNQFDSRSYFERGPVTFKIRFENKGTVHVKPRGYVTITNLFGKKVADIEFPQRNVLPNSVRKIKTSWNKKWLWGGKYTATLVGSYGTANNPLTPTVITFWAFPWKAGLAIFIVFILLVLSRRRWLAAFRILIKGEKNIRR